PRGRGRRRTVDPDRCAGDLARLRPAGILPGPRRPPPGAARRPGPVERLPAHPHHLGTLAGGAPPPAAPSAAARAGRGRGDPLKRPIPLVPSTRGPPDRRLDASE